MENSIIVLYYSALYKSLLQSGLFYLLSFPAIPL